jgi:hypothetical protein
MHKRQNLQVKVHQIRNKTQIHNLIQQDKNSTEV